MLDKESNLFDFPGMTLLEALWKTDGHKKPAAQDLSTLQTFIQDAEPQLGSERTYEALLALGRLAAEGIGFPKPNEDKASKAVVRQSRINATESDRLLDKKQMAQWLQVTTRTVDRMMNEGRLPYFRLGKTIRFRLATVIAELQENRYDA